MMNKILVFGGISFALILVFSSMANSGVTAPFLWMDVPVWLLVIYSSLLGIVIGYGLKGMFERKVGDDDNYDF